MLTTKLIGALTLLGVQISTSTNFAVNRPCSGDSNFITSAEGQVNLGELPFPETLNQFDSQLGFLQENTENKINQHEVYFKSDKNFSLNEENHNGCCANGGCQCNAGC